MTDSSTAAITLTTFFCSGQIMDADMLVNGEDWAWTTSGASDHADIQSVITHEAGHFIGFGHNPDPQSTMYFQTTVGDLRPRTLTADDAQGACDVYPAVAGTPDAPVAGTPDAPVAGTPDARPGTTPDARPGTTPDARPGTTPDARPAGAVDAAPQGEAVASGCALIDGGAGGGAAAAPALLLALGRLRRRRGGPR
jgi:hypothetical protein